MSLGGLGLCRMMSTTNIIGTKTMLVGSPVLQSPEQLLNESLGVLSDIYALSAVILVLFEEAPVCPALLPYQIMCKVAVCQERPKTDHLPPEIQELCNSSFADITHRPPVNMVLQSLLNNKKLHDLCS